MKFVLEVCVSVNLTCQVNTAQSNTLVHNIVTNKLAKFGAKIFRHLFFWDIAIFVLGYFILPHPVYTGPMKSFGFQSDVFAAVYCHCWFFLFVISVQINSVSHAPIAWRWSLSAVIQNQLENIFKWCGASRGFSATAELIVSLWSRSGRDRNMAHVNNRREHICMFWMASYSSACLPAVRPLSVSTNDNEILLHQRNGTGSTSTTCVAWANDSSN